MKMHLRYPGSDRLTFCGRKLRLFSTLEPEEVDCAQCLGSFSKRSKWFREQLTKNDAL